LIIVRICLQSLRSIIFFIVFIQFLWPRKESLIPLAREREGEGERREEREREGRGTDRGEGGGRGRVEIGRDKGGRERR
jgi:hypothetical protein